MRVAVEQLAQRLQAGLPPVIVLHGEETFLIEEAADQIRQIARQKGVNERQVWHVEGRFDWSQIRFDSDNFSLFSEQKLIEIRLPSGAPGKDGGDVLKQFAEQLPPDTFLVLISGKLNAAQQKTKWFRALDRAGIHISVWPVSAENLPNWIAQRMQHRGLKASRSIAQLIASRVEGHLYAAAQEIDKLVLLFPDGQLNEPDVLASVADSARFDAFTLADAIISGDAMRVSRMIRSIRVEGLDIMSVVSGITWSLRRWVDMAHTLAEGQSAQRVFEQQKPPVWDKARPQTLALLKRHPIKHWQAFLGKIAMIDQSVKGGSSDDPWRLLEQLSIGIAQKPSP